VSDAIITGAAGLLGVVVGGLLGFMLESLRARSERRRAVGAAAVRCLARLEKIKKAREVVCEVKRREPVDKDSIAQATKVALDEKWYLGGDLDGYLAAIAGRGPATEHGRQWDLYRMMVPMVIGADFDKLQEAIEGLAEVRGELIQSRCWWFRL